MFTLWSWVTPSSVPSGSNAVSLFLDRSSDTLTLSGHVVDNNTITTINAPGGSAQSGAISFSSSGAATVSMTGSTVNIDALDTDTKQKLEQEVVVHMVLLMELQVTLLSLMEQELQYHRE